MVNSYEHIMDTLIHKQYVIHGCIKLIKYLYKNGKQDLALELAKKCSIHDNSKLETPEFELFSGLPLEKESMKNPNQGIDKEVEDVISVHWKNNTHHPEHYSSYKEMSEIDIMEMVCDWYARSLQYHTDFLQFVKTRQENRFHFDKEFFDKIYHYCLIISDKNYLDNLENLDF